MKKKILALVFALVITCTTIVVVMASNPAYDGRGNNIFTFGEDGSIEFIHYYSDGSALRCFGSGGITPGELNVTVEDETYYSGQVNGNSSTTEDRNAIQ